MDAAAESGRNPASKHHIHPGCGKWAGQTRDGTAEAGSRYQIIRARTRTGKKTFSLFGRPRAGLATLPG